MNVFFMTDPNDVIINMEQCQENYSMLEYNINTTTNMHQLGTFFS